MTSKKRSSRDGDLFADLRDDVIRQICNDVKGSAASFRGYRGPVHLKNILE
jgi:hypothetical protein